ncbi:hypothetical protein BDN71DRAFT_1494751 [Pleurotus eryngii]|uniref:DUF659 domain-containing protein n=1 Tax=Pleurotus eryngii TaxID=5323 RepID=A0A9P6A006_PLEER|nr:hypothetical protein BDN71DRAFT_1494751 [Pleurotus eryngii]
MPFPAAEDASHEDMANVLEHLEVLLNRFPTTLPCKNEANSIYSSFLSFSIDPITLEHTGDECGAFSEQMKDIFGIFGWQSHTTNDGVVPILERGPMVLAMVPAFRNFLAQHPNDNVVKKWIIDVAIGAEAICQRNGIGIMINPGQGNTSEVPSLKRKATSSSKDDTGQEKEVKKGRRANDLALQLAVKGDGWWECVACGLRRSGNMQMSRILRHASTCSKLEGYDSTLRKAAVNASSDSSLGAKATGADKTNRELGSMKPSQGRSKDRLDITPFIEAGKRSRREADAQFQNSVNLLIVRLICSCGLVPNLIDMSEWRQLMTLLGGGRYHPTSMNTFVDKHIPHEAAHVCKEQISILSQSENLTLTFDGTSNRLQESFYTAHATTPLRQSYLLHGHQGSDEHHTSEWIKDKLLITVREVGESRWAASVSDNTNVTKACRRKLTDAIPSILNLANCVHHLQLLLGDITKLGHFSLMILCQMVSAMKKILRYFSKSGLSVHALLDAHTKAGEPAQRLQKIGKTRFGTYWSACKALEPCLTLIHDLAHEGTIKFKALFDQPRIKFGITSEVALQITALFNGRYGQFFDNDFYFTAFILDPRYRMDDFLKKPSDEDQTADTGAPYPRAFMHVKDVLKGMLRGILQGVEDRPEQEHHRLFTILRPREIAQALIQQLGSFWRNEPPFNTRANVENPTEWWAGLASDTNSQVLAMLATHIFNVLVNSMPDERTNSHITWFNSPIRGRQKAQTLIDMIQVGQYYRNLKTDLSKVRHRPAVKFRKLDNTVIDMVRERLDHDITMPEQDGESDDEDDGDTMADQLEDEESANKDDGGESVRIHIKMCRDLVFVIDDAIDLGAKSLLDMISSEAMVPDPVEPASTSQGTSYEGETIEEIDWDNL